MIPCFDKHDFMILITARHAEPSRGLGAEGGNCPSLQLIRIQVNHPSFFKCQILLNYGFCKKSFREDETLTSWTLLQHICPHFWAWLLLYSTSTPKSEDKYAVKVFSWSEFHLSEMTLLQNPYFKVHSFLKQCCVPSSVDEFKCIDLIFRWQLCMHTITST